MNPNNVQFDADQQQFKKADMSPANKSGLIGLLIKMGLAKDVAGANKGMYVILIINIILIFLVINFLL